MFGLTLEEKYAQIKKEVIKLLDAQDHNVVFTSGATESNNIVLNYYLNECLNNKKATFCTTVEHSSVLKLYRKFEGFGLKVTYLSPEDLYTNNDLIGKLTEDYYFGSVMSYNNETGIKSNIDKIRSILGNKPIIHTDSTQEIGKVPFEASNSPSDIFTFSGHKFHAVKGVGGILYKKRLKILPQHIGGGQEGGIRPGTTNLPGIYSLYVALRESVENNYFLERISCIRDEFEKRVIEEIEMLDIVNENYTRLHTTSYIRVKNVNTDILVANLNNIYVSNGSACNSYAHEVSHVAKEMMGDTKRASEVLRISFSRYNDISEIDYTIKELKREIELLRKGGSN
jgi:cysteine desulfurase